METVTENIMKHHENKNALTYGIVKETYSLNGETRDSYGIAVYANAEENGTATILKSVNDITTDYTALTELIEKLNQDNISPVHMRDIVEDFIA